MVLEEFGDRETFERAEAALGDSLTLREVIDLEFSTVHTPLDEVVAWMLEHVRVRPGFAEFAREHDPVVLSSSFVETIEPVLAREGVELRVLANHVEARPQGWRVRWRDETVCDHCREVCKRGGLPDGRPLVFVGTATRTAAQRSRPTACSRGTASPSTSTTAARRTSASRTSSS